MPPRVTILGPKPAPPSLTTLSFNGFGDEQLSIPIAGNPGAAVPADLFGDMSIQYGTASSSVHDERSPAVSLRSTAAMLRRLAAQCGWP